MRLSGVARPRPGRGPRPGREGREGFGSGGPATRPRATLGTAQQHALESLREMIISGELVPRQRVNQDQVAERLALSIAPVREALSVLQQEGQLTYIPRRGYFVTELRIEDLEEIYDLRRLLEERAARLALPTLTTEKLRQISAAARDCAAAADSGDIAFELSANRAFHLTILASPDAPHLLRIIEGLWDSTEAYRATYYNSPSERRHSLKAHQRILKALHAGDADRLVAEQNRHRDRALEVLRGILGKDNAPA